MSHLQSHARSVAGAWHTTRGRRPSSSIATACQWLWTGLTSLWREDPQIAAVLTPAFLKEFKAEFDRMVRERRQGVHQDDQELRFVALMYADSWESRHRLFEVMVRQYRQIHELSPLVRAEVIAKLMEHCQLPGIGLIC